MKIPSWLRWRLLLFASRTVSKRPPDFVIGDRYLARWWIIPRNPILNVYLHVITGDDNDRALHDHPWMNCSIILRGVYAEHLPPRIVRKFIKWRRWPVCECDRVSYRRPGSVTFRRAKALHRLAVVQRPVWSLFITGPKVRTWGFWCPQGWRPWYEFVDPENPGKVGRGCD